MHRGLELGERAGVSVIGIIRGCPTSSIVAVAGAAVSAGLEAVEVTLDSPSAATSIRALRNAFDGVAVGAGTVRTVAGVNAAADAGAVFIVSPFVDRDVITAALERGLAVLPGAATPTEVWGAAAAGATAVKVFPAASLGGPDYIAALRAPLGDIALVPTGGVGVDDAADYLAAGAAAVGVGSALFPASSFDGSAPSITTGARALVESTR